MSQWEYTVWEYDPGLHKLHEGLNEFGKLGWELVGIIPQSMKVGTPSPWDRDRGERTVTAEETRLVFKRAKTPEPMDAMQSAVAHAIEMRERATRHPE